MIIFSLAADFGEVYNAGESLQSLMKRYDVTADTILNHPACFIMACNPLRTVMLFL